MLTESLGHFVSADSSAALSDRQLRKYYADSTHQRIWTSALLPSHQADSLLKALRLAVSRAGFSERYFQLPQIQEDLDSTRHLHVDSLLPAHIERLARLEYLLSKAYLRFTMGQRYGFMANPEHHFNHLNVRDTSSDGRVLRYREIMHQGISQPDSAFTLNALAKASNNEATDYLQACHPASEFYRLLEEKLPETTDAASRRRILVNMERCRWQHHNRPGKDEKYVLVNVAAQQLWAVSTDTVFQMRIVCGTWKTKTPLMKCMMTWMVVNPEWQIPANIVRDEISRHGGDSAYFARHRYYIYKSSDRNKHINPVEVTSRQLAANLYRVAQERGPGNSLGRIKFPLSNPFDVYLHDTNNPGAFGRANRALSHGCVRVQRPFDLACFLLQLTDEREQDRLRIAIGMQPQGEKEIQWLEENGHDTEKVLNRFGNRRISPPVPVYIVYYTLYPNPEDNTLQTWGDPYRYDTQIWEHIKPFT